MKNLFIGIDISKLKIDCAVMEATQEVHLEKVVENSDVKIKAFILQVIKALKIDKSDLLIFALNETIIFFSNSPKLKLLLKEYAPEL